jgi:hypothetical protein
VSKIKDTTECHGAKLKFVRRGELIEPESQYSGRAFWCRERQRGWTSAPCRHIQEKK